MTRVFLIFCETDSWIGKNEENGENTRELERGFLNILFKPTQRRLSYFSLAYTCKTFRQFIYVSFFQ